MPRLFNHLPNYVRTNHLLPRVTSQSYAYLHWKIIAVSLIFCAFYLFFSSTDCSSGSRINILPARNLWVFPLMTAEFLQRCFSLIYGIEATYLGCCLFFILYLRPGRNLLSLRWRLIRVLLWCWVSRVDSYDPEGCEFHQATNGSTSSYWGILVEGGGKKNLNRYINQDNVIWIMKIWIIFLCLCIACICPRNKYPSDYSTSLIESQPGYVLSLDI